MGIRFNRRGTVRTSRNHSLLKVEKADTFSPSDGFTLLEIMLAISIFAVALIPALSLQNAALNRLYRNDKEFRAMLTARQIMSFMEILRRPPREEQLSGPAVTILEQLGTSATGASYRHPNPAEIEDLFVELAIEPWQIEGLPDNRLLRITAIVSWGPGEMDALRLNYIVPNLRSP